MTKIAATDRMARLIAAIPWIVDRGGAHIDEIAERFDYPRHLLLDDLQNVVFFVGVPPYTPDTLIEVQIDDDMVWIDYADWFSRPMKLSGGEALALLAAGETVLAFDNQEQAGPLVRGLAKLRLATGASSDALDVRLGSADESILRDMRGAVDDGVCVDITYYSFARDERTNRRIEPSRFFAEEGNWYVGGHCQLAGGDRVFRVDRIEALTVTDLPATVSPSGTGDAPFSLDDQPRATIRLPAGRAAVLDHVQVDRTVLDGEEIEATLPVSSARWLERLAVRVGEGVSLGAVDERLTGVDVAAAADRLLRRYGL